MVFPSLPPSAGMPLRSSMCKHPARTRYGLSGHNRAEVHNKVTSVLGEAVRGRVARPRPKVIQMGGGFLELSFISVRPLLPHTLRPAGIFTPCQECDLCIYTRRTEMASDAVITRLRRHGMVPVKGYALPVQNMPLTLRKGITLHLRPSPWLHIGADKFFSTLLGQKCKSVRGWA